MEDEVKVPAGLYCDSKNIFIPNQSQSAIRYSSWPVNLRKNGWFLGRMAIDPLITCFQNTVYLYAVAVHELW